jgi:hypothetical protein
MKKHCFVHSGRGRSLCAMHRRAARKLSRSWKISMQAAVFELRDLELDIEDARAARARELEAAIRTIQEQRALVASRRSTSKRKRASVSSRRRPAGINSHHGYCTAPGPAAIEKLDRSIR